MDSKEPLLLRITPTDELMGSVGKDAGGSGTITVHNPCLSGGTLEIFLDPVLPAPVLHIHGDGPIAQALVRLAGELEYRVVADSSAAVDGGQGGALAVVVASHGRDELEVLAGALDAAVPYVALVASRRRGAGVVAELAQLRPDLVPVLNRIHSPAGLDIGARTAAEIALSILAEVVSARVQPLIGPTPASTVPATPATAVDPVCGMEVAAVEASLHLDHDGRRVWFCGSGCLRAFSANPAGYPES